MNMNRCLLCAVAIAGVCLPALADQQTPSYLGDPLSYSACWTAFLNGDFSAGIEVEVEESYDDSDPTTTLNSAFISHLDFDSPNGWEFWDLPGGQRDRIHNPSRDATFVANVVNWIDLLPEKKVRINIKVFDTLGNGLPTITGVTGYGPEASGQFVALDDWTIPPDHEFYEDWIILPNPDWEQIEFYLPQGTQIDWIYVDTVSVPEPAVISLLMIGGLAVIRRRK